MTPTQANIDAAVIAARAAVRANTQSWDQDVIVAIADQLADAQLNAAQAVARARELEGEREEMLAKLSALFPVVIAPPDDDTCGPEDDTCGKCGIICDVDEGCEFEPGDPCHHCAQESYSKARALVARLTASARESG